MREERPAREKALIINAFALAGRLLFSYKNPGRVPWAMRSVAFQADTIGLLNHDLELCSSSFTLTYGLPPPCKAKLKLV